MEFHGAKAPHDSQPRAGSPTTGNANSSSLSGPGIGFELHGAVALCDFTSSVRPRRTEDANASSQQGRMGRQGEERARRVDDKLPELLTWAAARQWN